MYRYNSTEYFVVFSFSVKYSKTSIFDCQSIAIPSVWFSVAFFFCFFFFHCLFIVSFQNHCWFLKYCVCILYSDSSVSCFLLLFSWQWYNMQCIFFTSHLYHHYHLHRHYHYDTITIITTKRYYCPSRLTRLSRRNGTIAYHD